LRLCAFAPLRLCVETLIALFNGVSFF